jgi:polyphenol oxidase
VEIIQPNWDVPTNIKACCTTRNAKVIPDDFFANFNLATHVGDDKEQVLQNRKKLEEYLSLSYPVSYLDQNHTDKYTMLKNNTLKDKNSDGVYSFDKENVCAVLTADCLPLLFCNTKGTFVCAVHAGWQGLENEIIKKIKNVYPKTDELICWLGPAILKDSFEVGEDLYVMFAKRNKSYKKAFFEKNNKLYLDNIKLAKIQLQMIGVDKVYGGNLNTYTDDRFYSYRVNNKCGRMASLVWIQK